MDRWENCVKFTLSHALRLNAFYVNMALWRTGGIRLLFMPVSARPFLIHCIFDTL